MELNPLVLGLAVQGCFLIVGIILAIGCIRGIKQDQKHSQH